MKTEVVTINRQSIDQDVMNKAGLVIQQGGLVAFPTETVYGLGGDALNPASSAKIYAAKGRPSDNPLIVHIADLEALPHIVKEIPEITYALANRFWPGPMTIILHKSEVVPYETTGGLDTVAVRMPSDEVARAFIRAAGGYVAAPSANLSGKPSPTSAEYVVQDMDGRIELILDGGDSDIGLESTIVDLTESIPMILRPGYVTKEMLEELIEEVSVDCTILDANAKQAPKAPGMKYRHYAPKGELVIVDGARENVIRYINKAAAEEIGQGEKVGVIGTRETLECYQASCVKCAGTRQEEDTIARELYRILREFDDENVTVIYSESFDNSGIGQAIMNRLLKAAGHKRVNADPLT